MENKHKFVKTNFKDFLREKLNYRNLNAIINSFLY